MRSKDGPAGNGAKVQLHRRLNSRSGRRNKQGALGPRGFWIARFLITSRAPTLIDLLDEVADAWPGLSFEDFCGGYILSDMLLRFPDQLRAAEGMPPPGGDPIEWLDRIIEVTSPARGNA
jgi:hypothetical protein